MYYIPKDAPRPPVRVATISTRSCALCVPVRGVRFAEVATWNGLTVGGMVANQCDACHALVGTDTNAQLVNP